MDKDKHTIEEELILDRDTYRRIKKMDRNTLEGLIQDIFERGRKKVLAEAGVIVAEDNETSSDDHTLDLHVLLTKSVQLRVSVKREPRRSCLSLRSTSEYLMNESYDEII